MYYIGIDLGTSSVKILLVDEKDEVIWSTILWNDSRTAEETEYLNSAIGKARLSKLTANIAFAGFTAPKLLWVKQHELEHFDRIAKLMPDAFAGCEKQVLEQGNVGDLRHFGKANAPVI